MAESSQAWDPRRLSGQTGRVAVVTGANTGIGYFIAEQLASTGMQVVLACRNAERADAAVRALTSRVPGARAQTLALDTTDLGSVRAAADELLGLDRLDLLIENAGSTSPARARLQDAAGNELTLSTNVIGHFALTARVYPALARQAGARIVTMGSLATKLSSLLLDDLQLHDHYSSWRAYAQSKIVMQSFGFELARRLRQASSGVSSLVAHPGYSVDALGPRIPGVSEWSRAQGVADVAQGVMAQSKERGAWPAVRAALDPGALNGQFYGPHGMTRGRPATVRATEVSSSPEVGARVWAALEDYAGVQFELPAAQ